MFYINDLFFHTVGKPLPKALQFLRDFNPVKWGSEGALAAEFVGKELALPVPRGRMLFIFSPN